MGWQNYLASKYPDAYKKKNIQNIENTQDTSKDSKKVALEQKESQIETVAETQFKPVPASKKFQEKIFVHEDDTWRLELSSKGMGFKEIHLKKYTDREDK